MQLRGPFVHVISFLLALVLIVCLVILVKPTGKVTPPAAHIIQGDQQKTSGVLYDLTDGEQDELQFAASIQNPDQLTIFGSSEFTDAPYCSYNFLPDTLGIQALGIGHAFHQCFSILCELLAMYDHLENARICIILSPSWFHSEGTNSEAFTEFALPNFLARIATLPDIPSKYKIAIGSYISSHAGEFTAVSTSMEYFLDEYRLNSWNPFLIAMGKISQNMKAMYAANYQIAPVVYQVDSFIKMDQKTMVSDKKNYLSKLQYDFTSKITSNKIFVNDTYYSEYVLQADGTQGKGGIDYLDLEGNEEFEDFKLLVELLAERNADCSFVLQPVNPYYYEHTAYNLPLVDSITQILAKHQMPLLNMYVADTAQYQPGVLNDVMHLGDYGWMQINYFLDSLYHER